MILALEDTQISKAEWDRMTSDEQWQYIRILEKSDYELRQLLSINECPEHGLCIPHTRDVLKSTVQGS